MKERGLRSSWDPEWLILGASHSSSPNRGGPYGSTVRRDRLSSSPVGDRTGERDRGARFGGAGAERGRGDRRCCLYGTAMAVVTPALDLRLLGRVGLALADPTRRRILVALVDGPAYPGEMADAFGTTRANLSNHLTCLRECGLV